MLKFRQGKMMLANLFMIFALIFCSTVVIPEYGANTWYNVATYCIAAALLLFSICQILLAKKLYKIAKEESITSSKTTSIDIN